MDDKVISQLREFTDYDGNITFDVIRKFASFPDVSVWDQLGRG